MVERVYQAVVEAIQSPTRRRAPNEASLALTLAYVDLQFAFSLARSGDELRSESLVRTARAALPEEAVHDALVQQFVARIAQVRAGVRPEAPVAIARLGRVEAYKRDRMRECMEMLECVCRVDPMAGFSRAASTHPEDELFERTPAEALDAIDDMLASPRRAFLDNCIHALVVADYHGLDRMEQLFSAAIATGAPTTPWVAQQLCRVGRRHPEQLRALARGKHAARAGVLARVGDRAATDTVIAELEEVVRGRLTTPARVDAIRELARAYRYDGSRDPIERLVPLAALLRDITDSFGTNSHFCVSILAVTDALALAAAGP